MPRVSFLPRCTTRRNRRCQAQDDVPGSALAVGSFLSVSCHPMSGGVSMGSFTLARMHRAPVLLLVIVLSLAALGMHAAPAAAGQTQPLIAFRILVVDCD